MAFLRVVVICDCPTTVEKSWGLYFLAETINLSMGIAPIANLPQIPVQAMTFLYPRQKFFKKRR
jgi:hypothetical protein